MTLSEIIEMFIKTGQKLIPLLASIALLVFVFGVGKFIRASSDKDTKDSKNILIWGVIGLFIMFSIWGILAFFQSELGIEGTIGIPIIRF